MPASGIQKNRGSNHITVDEIGWRNDAAVNVTLRCKVDEAEVTMRGQNLIHSFPVRDVGPNEFIPVPEPFREIGWGIEGNGIKQKGDIWNVFLAVMFCEL